VEIDFYFHTRRVLKTEYISSQRCFSPLGESLSFACSKVSNQRKEHPTITAFGFPVLLDNLGGCGTRPSKLYKTQLAAELKQSSPKTPSLSALLGVIEGDIKPARCP
jgi:hypothetical protein